MEMNQTEKEFIFLKLNHFTDVVIKDWLKSIKESKELYFAAPNEEIEQIITEAIAFGKKTGKEEFVSKLDSLKSEMAQGLVYLADGFPPEKQWEAAEAHAEVIINLIKSKINTQ